MAAAPTKTRTLSTAEERREAVLSAATKVFGPRGFYGTPTLEVAKAAGISQAYLFRLFPTKDDLVIALVHSFNDRIESAFAAAAAQAKADGEDVLEAMGSAYFELLSDRDYLMLQLHAHAAAVDKPEIRAAMRASFERIYALVRRESGVSAADAGRFMQVGMAMNVVGALGAFELEDEWAQALMGAYNEGPAC